MTPACTPQQPRVSSLFYILHHSLSNWQRKLPHLFKFSLLHPGIWVRQMNSGATLKRQNTEWRGRVPCAWAEGVRLGKTKTSGSGDNQTWSLSYEAWSLDHPVTGYTSSVSWLLCCEINVLRMAWATLNTGLDSSDKWKKWGKEGKRALELYWQDLSKQITSPPFSSLGI